jgi:hypothetical protein
MIYPTNMLFLFQGWFTTRHRQAEVSKFQELAWGWLILYMIYIYIYTCIIYKHTICIYIYTHVCTHHISSYNIYRDLKITSKIWVDWQVCWCWHSRGTHPGLGAWNPWNLGWLMVWEFGASCEFPHLKICSTWWFNNLQDNPLWSDSLMVIYRACWRWSSGDIAIPWFITTWHNMMYISSLDQPHEFHDDVQYVWFRDIWLYIYTGWWFGTFFIFPVHIWDNPSHWRTH